jgi:hypothetical protein
MTLELLPILLPESADPSKFKQFGREVHGFNPSNFTEEQFEELKAALYKVGIYWFSLPQRIPILILSMMYYCFAMLS